MVRLRSWLESVVLWMCGHWPLVTYTRMLVVVPVGAAAICLSTYLGAQVAPDSSRQLSSYLTDDSSAQDEYSRLQNEYWALSRVTDLLNPNDNASGPVPAKLAETRAAILAVATRAGARECQVESNTTTCLSRSDEPAWATTLALLAASAIAMSMWLGSLRKDRELAPVLTHNRSYAGTVGVLTLLLLAPAFVFVFVYYRINAGPGAAVARNSLPVLTLVSLQFGAAWYVYVMLRDYKFAVFDGLLLFGLVLATVLAVPFALVLLLAYGLLPSVRPGLQLLAHLSPLLLLASLILAFDAMMTYTNNETTGSHRAVLVIFGLLVVGHMVMLRDREAGTAQYALSRGLLVTTGDMV